MSQQLQITGGAKVRALEGVITGSTGVLSSLPINGSLGIPQLDVNGKILVSQLPNSVMEYKGTWDASSNTPTLVNGTGNQGDVYLCSVAGTVNFGAGAISFVVSDQVIYSGTIWQKASGTSGTVTSVAASITGNSLGITGSPITTAGTLAFAFAGTNLQYVNGAGNLTTFPALTGYVPYTGATQDVDLGAFKLNAQSLHAKGTGGLGHLGLKHQSASATASANEVSLFADSNGDLSWLNGNVYLSKFITSGNTANRSYIFPNATGTIALTSDISYPVTSVYGRTGAVVATSGDYTTTQVTEGTNLYYTDTRARASNSFVAGSGAYNSTTGVITIPTNNNQITNGAGYITSSALSSYVPYTGATASVDLGAFLLTASGVNSVGYTARGSGTFSGYLILKQGTTFLGNVVGYNSINANSTKYTFISDVDGTNYKSASFELGSLTNNTNRAYILPDASGTLALLSANQVFTGSNTFTGAVSFNSALGSPIIVNFGAALTKGNTPSVSGSSFSNIYVASGNNNLVVADNSNTSKLQFQAASSYDYTFPAATGTIALVGGSGVGTVTSVAALTLGTSGTDLSSTVANSTTTPVITLNVPTASASNRGALSSADWTTFNNKQNALTNPVTGTGVNGRLAYWSGTNTITNSGNLTWDNTYSALSSPVHYALNASGAAFNFSSNTDNVGKIQNVTSTSWSLAYGTGNLAFPLGTSVLTWDTTNKVTFAGTLSNGTYTYTLPSATGTLALTSNLSSYLPLIGGTLTGGLYINPTNTGVVGLDVASDTIRFRSDNLEGFKRQLEITMGSGTLVQCVAKGFGGTYGTDLAFYTSSASGVNGSPAMYITGGNNIGIGTGLPSYTLDVSGTLRSTTSAYFATTSGNVGIGTSSASVISGYSVLSLNNATNSGLLDIQGNGTSFGYIYSSTSNNNLILQAVGTSNTGNMVFLTASSERMRITSGGQVYIGVTANAAGGALALAQNGVVIYATTGQYRQASMSGNVLGFFNGSNEATLTNAGVWTNASDISIKKDIIDIKYGLNEVMKLKPKCYKMIEDDLEQIGFIAQDVEEILPELVSTSHRGMKCLSYGQITAVLTKAIQEQNQTIEELSNRLIKLENK